MPKPEMVSNDHACGEKSYQIQAEHVLRGFAFGEVLNHCCTPMTTKPVRARQHLTEVCDMTVNQANRRVLLGPLCGQLQEGFESDCTFDICSPASYRRASSTIRSVSLWR